MLRAMRRVLLAALCAALMTASTPTQDLPLSPWLATALRQARPSDRHVIWIYFRDKGAVSSDKQIGPTTAISPRAMWRRALRGTMRATTSMEDVPVNRTYLDQVRQNVGQVRHASRWLNAVSAEATAAQARTVAGLPFVERVDLVRRYRRLREELVEPIDAQPPAKRHDRSLQAHATLLDYGTSLEQLAQIRVPELHDRGLSGRGIVVAVFDSGFPNLGHEVFERMNSIAEHDFVDGVTSVRASVHSHGTSTLSTLGGIREGQLVGPAYGASFMLAVTEDARSETPVEEDNWAAAAEWAERAGADIISSSLGYLDFDLPFTSYTYRDMDGATAVTTKAAAMAAARGVVVVNSAGNGGDGFDANTLGAPADGRQVIAVGAVDQFGVRALFSSVGPTIDGRIKPDVAARGVRVKVASTFSTTTYTLASGTSFSCPLTAGAVALLLEARPTYTPDRVILALRSTATQSASPDNLLGWGIVDAVRAVDADFDASRDRYSLPTMRDRAPSASDRASRSSPRP